MKKTINKSTICRLYKCFLYGKIKIMSYDGLKNKEVWRVDGRINKGKRYRLDFEKEIFTYVVNRSTT